MDILFYGDPHGEFRPLIDAVRHDRPGAVVILGDLCLERPLSEALAPIAGLTDIRFIHGNHDTDRVVWYRNLFEDTWRERNQSGRVSEVAGYRLAGLGGVFRARIWHPQDGDGQPRWQRRKDYLRRQPTSVSKEMTTASGLPRRHESTIWWEDYEALYEQRADILVTHEAPSCHRHGFAVLDELGEAMGVKRIIHGHHHEQYKARLPNGIIVHGVALAGIKTL